MVEVYLGLGSNMGDRLALMKQAAVLLADSGHFTEMVFSSLYETAPMGYTEQPPFLNAVFRGRTALSAPALLGVCQHVEAQLDRVRTLRWGPRTIDVDILLFGVETVSTESLTIPHPRLFERAFALMPLLEVSSPAISTFYHLSDRAVALADQGIRKLETYETNSEWNPKTGPNR